MSLLTRTLGDLLIGHVIALVVLLLILEAMHAYSTVSSLKHSCSRNEFDFVADEL